MSFVYVLIGGCETGVGAVGEGDRGVSLSTGRRGEGVGVKVGVGPLELKEL